MNESPESRRNKLERNWNSVWNNSTGRIRGLLRASRGRCDLWLLGYFDVLVGYHHSFLFVHILSSAELASISLSIVLSAELCSIPLFCVSFYLLCKGSWCEVLSTFRFLIYCSFIWSNLKSWFPFMFYADVFQNQIRCMLIHMSSYATTRTELLCIDSMFFVLFCFLFFIFFCFFLFFPLFILLIASIPDMLCMATCFRVRFVSELWVGIWTFGIETRKIGIADQKSCPFIIHLFLLYLSILPYFTSSST